MATSGPQIWVPSRLPIPRKKYSVAMNTERGEKPLYCHWDTHEHDVLFMSEVELDQHLRAHFMQLDDAVPDGQSVDIPKPVMPLPIQQAETNFVPKHEPTESFSHELHHPDHSMRPRMLSQGPLAPHPSPQQTVECHWDACHEMFNIDEIMEHFRMTHQKESYRPHYENEHCSQVLHCDDSDGVHGSGDMGSPGPFVRLNTTGSNPPTPSSIVSLSGAGSPDGIQSSGSDLSENHRQRVGRIDTSSLPKLEHINQHDACAGCHRCMWHDEGQVVCGKSFLTPGELNNHVVHDHIGKGRSAYTCEWDGCSRVRAPFSQRQKMVRHLQTHAKCSDYKCRTCDKTLSCDSQLRLHELSHTKDKPWTCRVCGRAFRWRTSVIAHERSHTGDKPLVCPHPGCNKRFSESSNLAKHRRTHCEPQFQCSHCQRKFTRRDHLVRHLKTKHKDLSDPLASLSQTGQTKISPRESVTPHLHSFPKAPQTNESTLILTPPAIPLTAPKCADKSWPSNLEKEKLEERLVWEPHCVAFDA